MRGTATFNMTSLVILWFSSWLLLVNLVDVSIQQCTTEQFEVTIPNIIETTQNVQNVSVSRITYNCLVPSSMTTGSYTSMSVSVMYRVSENSTQSQDVRYNMKCESGQWSVFNTSTAIMIDGVERTNCESCLDQTVNLDHCTRKYVASRDQCLKLANQTSD